ncbi:metal-dependent hydrolase [Halobaculum sp. CBA1158]|uniref:metal-dependent hydrolase n=1 Tax=Halobaculum sp. CBA1158 TaxID=2904243 RepID=UPI001F3014B4|nr:metal-dependent hydrolase [Halobaculum sp. CBA1158]UIO98530.1 metal-dependent hydrolase [Halobaculum sp. CBA1158]
MFVGHALAAFALVALATRRFDGSPARALTLGAVAGLFAAVPDVDIAYALVGVASGLVADAGVLRLAESFWSTGNVVHRGVTHSLVVAPVVALAAAAWVAGGRVERAGALALATGLVAVAVAVSGPLAGVVMAAFAAGSLAISTGVSRLDGVTPRATFALALVGLASHPFGDVFTGEPPAFAYPLVTEPIGARVALSADPTLHLLAAFGLELATVWAAVLVWSRLRAERAGRIPGSAGIGDAGAFGGRFGIAGRLGLTGRVDARAVAGAGYAASAFVIPAPTLELSYPFVFSVLAVGVIGFAPVRVRGRGRTALVPEFARPGIERAVFTGLSAVTLAATAYLVAYLVGVA